MAENPGGLYGDAPTPEETFAGGERYSVVLTDANEDTPMACMRGVRAAMAAITGAYVSPFEGDEMWKRFLGGERPLVIGWAVTPEGAKGAAEAGVEGSMRNLTIGHGLTPAQIAGMRTAAEAAAPEPEPESRGLDTTGEEAGIRPLLGNDLLLTPDDYNFEAFDPSAEGCKTAIALMHMAGETSRAVIFARILRRATADSLYDEVVAILLGSVPVVWQSE